jgi:dihydrofolate reductase
MRQLVESTFVTLDGVIGSPQEWGVPYWNDEHANYAHELLFAADALLLGRKTYEGFAQAWPSRTGDDYSDRINSMPSTSPPRRCKTPRGTRPSSREMSPRKWPR